jgi:hypothetical protein
MKPYRFYSLLSVIAFFFCNVIPYAGINSSISEKTLVKPAMAITEGQFSDVEITISRSIKSETTEVLTGITIHKI